MWAKYEESEDPRSPQLSNMIPADPTNPTLSHSALLPLYAHVLFSSNHVPFTAPVLLQDAPFAKSPYFLSSLLKPYLLYKAPSQLHPFFGPVSPPLHCL